MVGIWYDLRMYTPLIQFLKEILSILLFGVVLIVMALFPPAFVHNDTFFYAWPLFSLVLCSYVFISYLVYTKSRYQDPYEDTEEVVFESENGLMIVHEIPKPIPLTIKQSAIKGLWWTLYIYFLLIGALFIAAAFSRIG